jgi:hypothetical protein
VRTPRLWTPAMNHHRRPTDASYNLCLGCP